MCFVGIGIICIFLELSFIPSQVCHYNKDTKEEKCASSNAASYVVWQVIDFLDVNSSALSAFSTIIIACFTISLWRSTDGLHKSAVKQARDTRQSLEIADKSARAAVQSADMMFRMATSASQSANAAIASAEAAGDTVKLMEAVSKRQLRAYVHVSIYTPNIVISKGWKPEVEIMVKNVGQTPAHDMNVKGEIVIGHLHDGKNMPSAKASNDDSKVFLPPKAKITNKMFMKDKRALTDEEVENIRNGKSVLYVYGEIAYKDVFYNDCGTKFSFRTKQQSFPGKCTLVYCRTGNEGY